MVDSLENKVTNDNPVTLIKFESPVESQHLTQPPSPIQVVSPNRPVLSELKADLFGVIYPNEIKSENSFSASIFETTTNPETSKDEENVNVAFNASIF